MTEPIKSFQGEHRWLSNFWTCRIVTSWGVFPSVEHAYVAAKTTDENIRREIAALPTPGGVKRFGRTMFIRRDWSVIKLSVMEEAVRAKFMQHPELAAKLRATGNAELIEGNTWGDRFWGVFKGQGENHLGKILMKVREEMR